jgi:hypothetical protein
VDLVVLQDTEKLHAANKLTKKHILYEDNKMNVRLAVQTLSGSVASALHFAKEMDIEGFKDVDGTAEFAQNFNDIFDLLNCRSKFKKKKTKYNVPISAKSYETLKSYAAKFELYIVGLKCHQGKKIIQTAKKIGFIGLVVCLRNIFAIYDCLKEHGLQYLLTYKLLQDHLETFFSAMRAKGGFNNNPNAQQFEAAYKRLLVRSEISAAETGNCLISDIQILHARFEKVNTGETGIERFLNEEIETDVFDDEYVSTWYQLSSYVEDVVKYVAGFIVFKLTKHIVCQICRNHLVPWENERRNEVPLLIKIKNKNNLSVPSADVIKICSVAEKIFRCYHNEICSKNIKEILLLRIYQDVCDRFNTAEMDYHVSSQTGLQAYSVRHLVKS